MMPYHEPPKEPIKEPKQLAIMWELTYLQYQDFQNEFFMKYLGEQSALNLKKLIEKANQEHINWRTARFLITLKEDDSI